MSEFIISSCSTMDLNMDRARQRNILVLNFNYYLDGVEYSDDMFEKSDAKEFIIGTESSIVQHLQFECPEKRFYPLSQECICTNMKLTTLGDVYHCVKGTGGEEIVLSEDVREKAKNCIDKMLELG